MLSREGRGPEDRDGAFAALAALPSHRNGALHRRRGRSPHRPHHPTEMALCTKDRDRALAVLIAALGWCYAPRTGTESSPPSPPHTLCSATALAGESWALLSQVKTAANRNSEFPIGEQSKQGERTGQEKCTAIFVLISHLLYLPRQCHECLLPTCHL